MTSNMTLAQAGTTLERFGKNREHSLPSDVSKAIETVVSLLPRIPETTTAKSRYDELRDMVMQVSGLDISAKKRDMVIVTWRRCVWYLMNKEGYGISDIGKACGFNHATVLFGIRKQNDYLQSRDILTVKIWNFFTTIIINS